MPNYCHTEKEDIHFNEQSATVPSVETVFFSAILFLVGVFALLGSFFQWAFFFRDRKARTLVNAFGMRGARLFYAAIGVIAILLSIASSAG